MLPSNRTPLPLSPTLLLAAVALSGAAHAQLPGGPGSSDEEVLFDQPARLPYTGLDLRLMKLRDPRTGAERRLVLDQDLREVELDELLAAEAEIERQLFGNLHSALHRRVQDAPDAAPVEVLVKLRVEEEELDKSELDRGLVDAAELELRALEIDLAVRERAEEALAEVAARHAFAVPAQRTVAGPFVETTLPARAVRALARDERVAFVGPAGGERVEDFPTIPQSLPSTQSHWAQAYFSKGTGTRVAVLETGQATTPQSCFRVIDRQTSSGPPNSHMTKSLGILGNRYGNGSCTGPWEGYAPEASVLMANASSYVSAYDWAKSRNADVVTMSWHFSAEETTGALHSRDVFFDYWAARYPYPMIFTSAGNQALEGAYASGKGYNFFGVGNALNDGDGWRCDDAISSDSSFKDPISPIGHREIPEIAAPGSRHDLLGSSFGGTSCATPVSAGIAAVVLGGNPSLRYWPEGLRAILLATANMQDADGSDFTPWGDGKDGTGVVNAFYASLAALTRATSTGTYFYAHDYGSIRDEDFTDGWFDKTWKAYTSSSGQRIRIAFTWNSRTTSSSSVLDSDLDLRVFNAAGTPVATSSTWDNNYEFVEFLPPTPGTYTIKVREYGLPSDFSSYFGVAWTYVHDCP